LLFGSVRRYAAFYLVRAIRLAIGRSRPSSITPASMKINFSGPRSLAVSVMAGLFSLLVLAGNNDEAHYRAMSKDAIVAELVSKHNSPAGAVSVSLIMVLAMVVGVDVLTGFFDAAWRRMRPGEDGSPLPPQA